MFEKVDIHSLSFNPLIRLEKTGYLSVLQKTVKPTL